MFTWFMNAPLTEVDFRSRALSTPCTISVDECRTQENTRKCKFPFFYEGRYRFECVKRTQESTPECPMDPDNVSKQNGVIHALILSP